MTNGSSVTNHVKFLIFNILWANSSENELIFSPVFHKIGFSENIVDSSCKYL